MTMRVLVVHNRYRSAMPSGENNVVDEDIRMLRDAGVEVATFFRDSDEIEHQTAFEKAALVMSPSYDSASVRAFRRALERFRPDVVHLHNPFPLISPYVVRVAKHAGVPVVQTVHNYRHACPGSTSFLRDGRICEDCAGRAVPWPAVVHGCYRESRAQSLSMAVATRVHRSTWMHVDRFLPVSSFVARKLAQTGIPHDRITVRPNATPSRGAVLPPGAGFVFVGRLTAEKGVALLADAWRRSGLARTCTLTVLGDGPQRPLVDALGDGNVRVEGLVSPARVADALDEAAIVVIPSLCYEGFPRLVAEAFERGRPIAATNLGALGDLVTPEVGWTAGADVPSFAQMLTDTAADTSVAEKGKAARVTYENELAPAVTAAQLLDVYTSLATAEATRRPPLRR